MDQPKPEQSRELLSHSEIHERWERDYLSPELDAFYDAAFARIVSALDDRHEKTILDIGCGYCYHTKRLARSKLSITAVDFSAPALARARETLAQSGIEERVVLRQADATNLPFADASFDNVLFWGVLMHIPEAEAALRHASRVLRPGGKLVVAENNLRSLEVVLLEPLINFIKRLIGRRPHERRHSKLGIEEWQPAAKGGLMVRKTDMVALTRLCDEFGLDLERRFAGQLTEVYTRVPNSLLKRMIHWLNRLYFENIGWPGPAIGNILVFSKRLA